MNAFFFQSSCAVNPDDGSGFIILCRSQHIYCFRCLFMAMNQYLTLQIAPVCNINVCDYQISRHDLACIPLTQRMFRKLLALIKTQQRPQCPRCRFYVDLQQITDLDEHLESCRPENMIPCELCYCPQESTTYDEHRQLCRYDRTGRQQRLIDFILPRTKYPFSARQIDYFIENQKKVHRRLNPLSIVEDLAVYGKFFVCPLTNINF